MKRGNSKQSRKVDLKKKHFETTGPRVLSSIYRCGNLVTAQIAQSMESYINCVRMHWYYCMGSSFVVFKSQEAGWRQNMKSHTYYVDMGCCSFVYFKSHVPG